MARLLVQADNFSHLTDDRTESPGCSKLKMQPGSWVKKAKVGQENPHLHQEPVANVDFLQLLNGEQLSEVYRDSALDLPKDLDEENPGLNLLTGWH